MNILNLLNESWNRVNREQGFGMIEIVITIAMLGMITAMTTPIISNLTAASTGEYKAQQGIDQGPVMEEVKAAQESAQRFHEALPDLEVTKENMALHGYVPTVSSDLRWDVGQQSRYSDNADNQVCAFGWSDSRQSVKYTASQPALFGYNGGITSLYTEGCSYSDFKRVAAGL